MSHLVLGLLTLIFTVAIVVTGVIAGYLHWFAKASKEDVLALSAFVFMAAVCSIMLLVVALRWYDPASWA